MKKTPLEKALFYLSRRKFTECLYELESSVDLYRDSFSYYLVGGVACLYLNDFGNANLYFQKARQHRQTDVALLLGQAVLYLRHGDTDRAIQYYLDVLDIDRNNKIAKKGIAFIREKGTYEEIFRLIDSNGLKKFYPPLGLNPSAVLGLFFTVLLAIAVFVGINFCLPNLSHSIKFRRSGNGLEAADFSLSSDQLKNTVVADYKDGQFAYILSESEVERLYKNVYKHATEPYKGDDSLHRTNLARSEANVILNSNASDVFKFKVQEIVDAIEADKEHAPNFSTIIDNFACEDVISDMLRYDGCYVIWTGMLASPTIVNGVYKCNFLVWDDNIERLFGSFDLYFQKPPATPISGDRIVQILAKIKVDTINGKNSVSLIEKANTVMLRNQKKVQSLNQD
ncbi:MAG: hypothetical protein IKO57_11405 [Treponema sp.]|nr:hypothetical protein [Treponema sp.]MBR4631027.1 hypothetical protein [Treponema sp.]MCR5125357.1 hypothetical protein [Treponema sp.]